ncbi:Ferritin heavy chain 1 [Brachionus plicatilis]|uniref:Ferritin n=1 Tax=Brachionus plicatilis TaxID=10195 RepID=A0A3M7T4I1_BRAPC|nr:Ferritin heavy chain 1 [Brachionus plicatilis]
MYFKIIIIGLIFQLANATLQSRARQNFNCDDKINQQIAKEFEASQIYLSLANYFGHDRVALEGFAKMFKHSWKEELEHAQKMIEYGLLRGAKVDTPSVPKPVDSKWLEMNTCQIVDYVLNLEKSVNDHLLQVHRCGESDPQLQDFIEGEYLKEQVDANKELSDLLSRLERTTMHLKSDGTKTSLCDGLGLHIIDQELSKKFA